MGKFLQNSRSDQVKVPDQIGKYLQNQQSTTLNYRRGTDVLKILLKIDRLNRDFGCF